ncbi:MAG TPA: VWA domain-containing protein [Gemmatimonadota bacterium]|nr:VWA domain-containing protein [Gemmatimonadota bacterium]
MLSSIRAGTHTFDDVLSRATPIVSFCLLALILWPLPAEAQLGRLKNMVAGVEKGEMYGEDVTDEGSPIVFVVDLTPVVDLPQGAVDNLKQMVAQQGEAYVRQKLAEEGTDWALRAAGPAGMAVREVMRRRSDRTERARNHVRAAIEGLEDDQRFGLVTFEGGPSVWRSPAPVADESNREEAREFVGGLQKVEGDGFLQSALLVAAGLAVDPALYGAGGAGGVPPAGVDPTSAAMAAQAGAVQGAIPTASSSGTLSGPTVSAENLLRGIELAFELEPEAIVVVLGAAPSEDAAGLLARVEELAAGRDVTIHAAVFGENQSGGVLRDLAKANDGELLTDEEEEPDEED